MSISMQGKVALITGGARGIGAAMAAAFAAAGAKVMVSDILEAPGRATVAAILESGGDVDFVAHDVRDEASWQAAIDATLQRFGTLTTLVNNAGIETSAQLTEIEVDQIDRLLAVNVRGLILGMKHSMRAMRAGGAAGHGGSILNLSSLAQLRASPGTGVYAATKAAVDRLTRVGAAEGGPLGVRVNCLYPGLIQTDMLTQLFAQQVTLGRASDVQTLQGHLAARTPLGRLGAVEDVANAAMFLSSDLASFITGVGLSVDGGMALA